MFRLSNLISSVVENRPERTLNGSIAIWNFTNRCNLSCLHCYSKSTLDEVDTLTTEQIKKTILEMKENGVKFIIFSGGEPLTRKDLFEIADFCKKNGIVTYLSSNGLYFTNKNIQRIVDTFNYVGVSIDGDEPTHDHFRGLKGAFVETLKAVKLANATGAKVGTRYTITKETLGSLEYIFDLAERENIPKIYVSHLVYSGQWGGNSAGRNLLNINSEGDVRPDPFFPLTVGNIIEEDFGSIWQSGELLDELRIHPRKQIDICNGASRARAYAVTGDLWSEDPSCYLTKEERE